MAFPFPLDCIWAEIHFTLDSLQARRDKKYPVFRSPEFYLWLEDDVTLTSIARKDDGEEKEKGKVDISTLVETN